MPTEPSVDQLQADYDTTPYVSNSFPQSAPGQLAATALLFGLETPPIPEARVLEIGCAAGGNLIPFAAAHPGANVVGIDLSPVQIDEGRRRVQAAGLDNLTLIVGDVASMDLSTVGEFDYVIAHGVYSWVPPHVQDAVLRAMGEVLTPNGVAYVSYNVYPGWKSKEIVRDAMLFASRASTTPEDKVYRARGMVDFLEEVAPEATPLARAVAEFRERDYGFGDSYLLHDELERFNLPCYFVDMVERAAGHGLAYLAESRPEVMFPGNYAPSVPRHVYEQSGGSQVLIEQYLDFVADRAYRESLFVHAERGPRIRYDLDRNRYGRLHFAARVMPVDGQTQLDASRQGYEAPGGSTMVTDDPGTKAAFDVLTEHWPWTLSAQELLREVQARLAVAGVDGSAGLEERVNHLLEVLIVQGLAKCRVDPVAPPPASAPLRLHEPFRRTAEATRRHREPYTFNFWHEIVDLSPLDGHLLALLDGTRHADALVEEMLAIARADLIRIEIDGIRLSEEAVLRDVMTQYVDALPVRLDEMKLLRAEG
jgi:SAM-dependent methyltransferase/methyltransferase-like protein